jgi:hypothetical protein
MFTRKIKCKLVHKLVIFFSHKMLNFVLCQVSTLHIIILRTIKVFSETKCELERVFIIERGTCEVRPVFIKRLPIFC